MSDRTARFAGLYAMVAAGVALVVTPLLALSYFGIADGASMLDQTTVSAWADPASDRLSALLTWSSPDRVYATYIQLFALLFPAVFLCALVTRSRRVVSEGRLERWGWRIALSGYGVGAVGFVAVAFLLIGSSPNGTAVNSVFLALMVPGMLLSLTGSTTLGIGFLRNRYAPRLTAWLLVLTVPFMIVGAGVLGHIGLGMLPLFIEWGIAGRNLRQTRTAGAGALGTATT